MFKPLGKLLLVELLDIEEKGFVKFDREGNKKKTLNYAIVKEKGDDCRKTYDIGSKIVFIADQEYPIKDNLVLLFDEDVLGVDDE